ncbi:alpha-xylosidase [Saccharibacillus alkalitolerans]|uniref:Alpha-xylosidase n=1 Tax=Saccharibacillus alkalitolerans TaxID=2705290 RepID=A0ABX0F3I7_9BACL|nr:alpha-xylosidase [Saccharibacillus alkalitolerans]NGZ74938.1 alpha-xylosidase [Saccharibacillus alkalitolerans]
MKFTDGYWHIRPGVTLNYPVEVRDVYAESDHIQVFGACKKIVTRGDTLNTAILTFRYSSPMPDVICVESVHHEGKRVLGPRFEKNEHPDAPVTVTENEQSAVLTSGNLSVRIDKNNGWSTHFHYGERRLTGSGYKSPGHLKTADGTYMREQLDLGVGERIYGLGERFTPFVKNGQVVDLWNEDGGTCSEQAYKNVPFYLSSFGYGVFVDHPEKVSYEVGSEQVEKVQFSVPGERLRYYIVGGDTLKDVLANYTALTGRPALPPAWSYGLWLSTSFTTPYDEDTVNHFVDGMFERNIPVHVFHFDCFWMKEFQWCDFRWDTDQFPDPQGMLNRLKAKGLNICVWINSYIGQKSYLFREGMERGYLVKTTEGDVWQWDRWQGGMGLVDFTNPDAAEWFKSKLRPLIQMGVDSFKTDFGERIPSEGVVYHDGSDPVKMHNYYTFLYNKAVFEVLEEVKGRDQALVFARSATAGGQQFPVHWGGDCTASYVSMAETLRGGLSLGLCGFGFWSHDISGFENTASPDVYKRWSAFGLLSSHSRLHGSQSYRVPWLFDDEASEVLRHFTALKMRLMPYLFASSLEAVSGGLPMMRAMLLEFGEDPACEELDRQYMLGGSLLVAPIFNERGEALYYLPEGRWTHLLSGEEVQGGRWRRENYDYFGLPLFVRPNTLLALGANESRPDYDYADGAQLHLFALEDGREARAAIYAAAGAGEAGAGRGASAERGSSEAASGEAGAMWSASGEAGAGRGASAERGGSEAASGEAERRPELSVAVRRDGRVLTVTAEEPGRGGEAAGTAQRRPWTLVLRGIGGIESADGADAAAGEQGVVLTPAARGGSFTVTLSEG